MQTHVRYVRMNAHDSRSMYFAHLICSDEDCAETIDVRADTLDELEALICDCDCGLQVLGISEAADVEADLGFLAAYAVAA